MQVLETCLYVDDLEAALRFYRDIVGLPLITHVPERHVFFRAGAGVLLVFDPAATAHEHVLPPHGAHGPGHVAFAVPAAQIDGWKTRLQSAGIAIAAEHTWPQGGRSIYVHDPAGNVVEFAPPAIWGIQEEEPA